MIMQVDVFMYEGCYFLGKLETAQEVYKKLNPSKKFFIWLLDNYTELKANQ